MLSLYMLQIQSTHVRRLAVYMLTYSYMHTKHGYGYMENINRIAAKRNVNIVLQISEMEIPHHTYNLFMQSSIDIARSVCVVGVYKGVYNRRTYVYRICISEMWLTADVIRPLDSSFSHQRIKL